MLLIGFFEPCSNCLRRGYFRPEDVMPFHKVSSAQEGAIRNRFLRSVTAILLKQRSAHYRRNVRADWVSFAFINSATSGQRDRFPRPLREHVDRPGVAAVRHCVGADLRPDEHKGGVCFSKQGQDFGPAAALRPLNIRDRVVDLGRVRRREESGGGLQFQRPARLQPAAEQRGAWL